jgi:hypothetical protein
MDAPLKPARRLYFVNGPVDFLFMGGLSVAAFAAMTLWSHTNKAVMERTNPAIVVAGFLVWIVNWPHFSATSFRLYHSRANIAQYPMTALLVPVVMMAAIVGSFLSPKGIAPYFVKLFTIWSPYHFSGQSVGLTLVYARRAGFKVGKLERMALSGFVYGSFICATAAGEAGTGMGSYYTVEYPLLGLPYVVAQWSTWGMYACGAAFLLLAFWWSLRQRRLVPPIVLLPAVSQYLWFIPGARILSYAEFVPFFHSLQYMLIAWSMQLKERLDQDGIEPSPRYVLSESLRWGLINFTGGALLFFVFPQVAGRLGRDLPFASAVVLAAVQIHHFFVDGVIWKLRNPKVGSPLLVNLEEMIRPEPRPAREIT